VSGNYNIPDDELSFKGIGQPKPAPPTPGSTPPAAPRSAPAGAPQGQSRQPAAPSPASGPVGSAKPATPREPSASKPTGKPAAGKPTARADAGAQAKGAAEEPRGPLPDRRSSNQAQARAFDRRRKRRGMGNLSHTSSSPRHQIEAWLAVMVKSDASDLILRAGGRPSQRVGGKISFLPGRVPGPGPLLEVLEGVMGKSRMEGWKKTGSADSAIHLDGLGRFRLNAYKQMGEPAVVIRRIGEDAPNLDQLDLPATELKELSLRKRGLVLVTGIAGSGKSTTLAGMIQYMNENVERHVVTLEDPVELLFKEQNCVISQREVGTDTTTFKDGLRHALRQSPDVILIGEVRDAETVVAALEATETGHMVLSTMHTVNAAQTVDRILGFFPAERHAQIRQRMADNLAGVLSQRLVPAVEDKKLLPAYELMLSTPHVRELLEEGKTTEIARVIESGSEAGLISFNECLRRLVEERKVDLNDALAASDRPDELLLALRGIRGSAERVQGPAPANPSRGGGGRDSGGPDGLRMAGGDR